MVNTPRPSKLERTLRKATRDLKTLLQDLEQELDQENEPSPDTTPDQLCVDYFSIAPVGLFIATLGGELRHVNPTFAAQLCYPNPAHCVQAITRVNGQLFTDSESFATLSGTLHQHREAHLSGVKALGCEGRTRWLNVHARRLHAHQQSEELALFAVEDVTERVRRDTLEREEHLRYKTLFENAAEALFQCAPDGALLMVNKAFATLFGFASPNDLYDQRPNLPALLRDPLTFNDFMRQLRQQNFVSGFETQALRPDESFWASMSASILHDQSGEPLMLHGSLRDISNQKQLEAKILREGFRDTLTGLANRPMFLNLLDKYIARARRREDFSFALVALQVDSFRSVKLSLGHSVAEEMLTQVSHKLVEQLRTEDICSRLGSDEFGLLLTDVTRPADAIRVLERVNAALSQPLHIQDNEIFPRLSSGIVLCDRDPGTPESMLDDADTALYRARADSVQHFAVFNEAMQREATERLRTESDLRRALEREEFMLHFQPIISVPQGKVAGFEALLRWQRPGVGLTPPDLFVPLLEETGLIVMAGEWALMQACMQARTWQRTFAAHKDLGISVNISPRQLLTSDLVTTVENCLRDSGLPAASLKLEITENLFMEEPRKAMQTLGALKGLGVGLSIDDFGTGYSSLAYLNHLPADTLKIDKSFVQGLRSEVNGHAIVKTIKLLADSLGKDVVVEGVETSDQLTTIIQLQCPYVQGYYFSKPLPADDATNLLSHGFES